MLIAESASSQSQRSAAPASQTVGHALCCAARLALRRPRQWSAASESSDSELRCALVGPAAARRWFSVPIRPPSSIEVVMINMMQSSFESRVSMSHSPAAAAPMHCLKLHVLMLKQGFTRAHALETSDSLKHWSLSPEEVCRDANAVNLEVELSVAALKLPLLCRCIIMMITNRREVSGRTDGRAGKTARRRDAQGSAQPS